MERTSRARSALVAIGAVLVFGTPCAGASPRTPRRIVLLAGMLTIRARGRRLAREPLGAAVPILGLEPGGSRLWIDEPRVTLAGQ